jgi:transcriptional regulator with AAA-type ATPase domain
LLPKLGEREGDSVELTEGFFGRIDGEVKLAATDQGHDGFLAWTAC